MLINIHPNFIEKKGKKEFVVISIEEYKKITETLEDYEDLMTLRNAKEKEKEKKGKNIEIVKKELGIK